MRSGSRLRRRAAAGPARRRLDRATRGHGRRALRGAPDGASGDGADGAARTPSARPVGAGGVPAPQPVTPSRPTRARSSGAAQRPQPAPAAPASPAIPATHRSAAMPPRRARPDRRATAPTTPGAATEPTDPTDPVDLSTFTTTGADPITCRPATSPPGPGTTDRLGGTPTGDDPTSPRDRHATAPTAPGASTDPAVDPIAPRRTIVRATRGRPTASGATSTDPITRRPATTPAGPGATADPAVDPITRRLATTPVGPGVTDRPCGPPTGGKPTSVGDTDRRATAPAGPGTTTDPAVDPIGGTSAPRCTIVRATRGRPTASGATSTDPITRRLATTPVGPGATDRPCGPPTGGKPTSVGDTDRRATAPAGPGTTTDPAVDPIGGTSESRCTIVRATCGQTDGVRRDVRPDHTATRDDPGRSRSHRQTLQPPRRRRPHLGGRPRRPRRLHRSLGRGPDRRHRRQPASHHRLTSLRNARPQGRLPGHRLGSRGTPPHDDARAPRCHRQTRRHTDARRRDVSFRHRPPRYGTCWTRHDHRPHGPHRRTDRPRARLRRRGRARCVPRLRRAVHGSTRHVVRCPCLDRSPDRPHDRPARPPVLRRRVPGHRVGRLPPAEHAGQARSAPTTPTLPTTTTPVARATGPAIPR